MDVPNVAASEAKAAVRWSIKDLVDYPIETAMVDAVSIPGSDASGRPAQMLAVAARNDTIAATVKPFSDADIALEVIDIPEFAQRNVAKQLEDDARGLAMLSFDDSGALLTFTGGGELYQARRIDVSLQDFEPHTNNAELFDRVALELQRSLDHFDRQFRNITVARVVLSQVPAGDQLAEYLRANLTVPVAELDMSTIIDFPGVPELRNPLRQSQCLQLIGAAMREERAAR